MITREQLYAMKNTELADVDRDSLVEIKTVTVESSLSGVQRLEDYVSKIKNPYCFLCDGTKVRIRFVSDERTFSQAISSYFISLK
jgi:hypothetical protein